MCHNPCVTLVCSGPEHQVWLVGSSLAGTGRCHGEQRPGQHEQQTCWRAQSLHLGSVSWLLACLITWARMGCPLEACGLPSYFGGAQFACWHLPTPAAAPFGFCSQGQTDVSPELPSADASFQQHSTLWPEGDYISARNRIFKINSELKWLLVVLQWDSVCGEKRYFSKLSLH